jgi:hypothetical protein
MNVKNKFKNFADDVTNITNGIGNKMTDTLKGISDGASDIIGTVTKAPKDLKYITSKNEEIKIIIEETNKKIDPIRDETNKKLEELGKVKVDITSTTLEEFSQHMREIENIPFDSNINTSSSDSFNFSKKELDDLKVSVLSIKEVLKNSAGAGATGAIGAGAAYSAVAAFGAASTGTLISSISGIAASNATLAWLGGGALAAGGGGIALGTVVLGGIAIVPAFSYLIWKGKFNYSQEREAVDKNYLEAIEYAEKINSMIDNFKELSRLIDNTILLINNYSIECNKLNKQTDHIKHQIGLNYKKYSKDQKALINKHITYITKLLQLINTPVMKEDGSFNSAMLVILKEANQFLDDASEIEFVNYKKTVPVWYYILPTVITISIASYVFYTYI